MENYKLPQEKELYGNLVKWLDDSNFEYDKDYSVIDRITTQVNVYVVINL